MSSEDQLVSTDTVQDKVRAYSQTYSKVSPQKVLKGFPKHLAGDIEPLIRFLSGPLIYKASY